MSARSTGAGGPPPLPDRPRPLSLENGEKAPPTRPEPGPPGRRKPGPTVPGPAFRR